MTTIEKFLNYLKEVNGVVTNAEVIKQEAEVMAVEVKTYPHKTEDEKIIFTDTEALAIESNVFMDELATTPAENGDYNFDGTIVTVLDGKITDIKEKEVEAEVTETETVEQMDGEGDMVAKLEARIAKLEEMLLKKEEVKQSVETEVVKQRAESIEVQPSLNEKMDFYSHYKQISEKLNKK